jgi:hypothetical protein
MYFRLPAKLAGMEEILPEDENERQSLLQCLQISPIN